MGTPLSVALAGLPLSGKTCLFDALCEGAVDSAASPARPDHPNRATIAMPDARLDWLAGLYGAPKQTPIHLEVLDVPGLAPGRPDLAAQNTAILEHLRRADALVHVLRAFQSDRAPHPLGRLDPAADRDLLFADLLISDLDVTLRRIEKLRRQIERPLPDREAHKRELDLLERLRLALEAETPLADAIQTEAERTMVRGFTFLTQKPVLVVLNVDEGHAGNPQGAAAQWGDLGRPLVALAASLEAEIGQLQPDERPAFLEGMGLKRFHTPDVLRGIHEVLDRITVFTCGEKEVTARSLPRGSAALGVAADVHTDMARGFIRAEVIPFEHLKAAGSLKDARAAGHYRVEGRDFIVHDGDILHIHFSH
jgi:hypothetical protein